MGTKALLQLLLIFIFSFLAVRPVKAKNIFGIHILETGEVNKAAQLVNSSGGDWGYITIVLREDDFNKEKWQKFFNDCRRLHLIPIVRIATHMEAGVWAKPSLGDLNKWPDFLASLNWPVKKQIIVIFNEPNQAKEWGGEISPREYVLVLDKLITLFKQKNKNFFVLNAGFDQAADGKKETIRENDFLKLMFKANNNIFNQLDGWASHSYPNHGFVGQPTDKGRASIRGYEWELIQLRKLGLNKALPVFITETGWPHQEGKVLDKHFYQDKKIAQLLLESFSLWEKDDKIKAVCPFVLNYPQQPFDHFSWLKENGKAYEQFKQVLKIKKGKNLPEQIESYKIVKIKLSDLLPTNYVYHGQLTIKNTGQWIMGEKDNFVVPIKEEGVLESQCSILIEHPVLGKLLLPGEEKTLAFSFKTGHRTGEEKIRIGDKSYKIYVFKPFELKNSKISLWRQVAAWLRLWWADFSSK